MTRYDIYQNKPASSFGDRWRDSTPLGNGYTGIALYGGVAKETVIINRADLWHGGEENGVPEISHVLNEMRALQSKGDYIEACNKMYSALQSADYSTELDIQRTLGCVEIAFDCKGVYSQYKRTLHLDTAESEITYKTDNVDHVRKCFVSRKRDLIVMQICSSEKSDLSLTQGFFNSFERDMPVDPNEPDKISKEIESRENDAKYAEHQNENGCMVYSSKCENKFFGIVTKALSDGEVIVTSEKINIVNAKSTLIVIKAFSNKSNRQSAIKKTIAEIEATPLDYKTLFKENKRIYGGLYNKADVKLYSGRTFHSNEELILEAMQQECSPELIEKLWRFGRYLFISGVAKKGVPFPLYGLWPCGYERPWSQHVGNENVEVIHWHAAVGGLIDLVSPLIDFYHSKMEGFRENARKLYGCKGIFVGVYLSKNVSLIAPPVPVILHFLGVAGWISRHFYEYYLCTRDEKTFKDKIIPFMVEAAEFYEDYIYYDKDGMIELYPACSPENTPREFMEVTPTRTGHPMPVTKNPTIEFAILKELLSNLIEISKTHSELREKAVKWKDMLSKIPEYMINEDGAIAEWMDPEVHDNYEHRHLSHVYPIFPATEIEDTERFDLIPAFKKAVELRELGFMTGWSLMHMAAIYARLNESEKVFECFNMLSKVCLLENFFTLHNDYRTMGITATDMGNEIFAPVQLDALLGSVNAVQEMLIYVSAKTVKLLPACSKRMPKGSAKLRFFDGAVSLKWDLNAKTYKAIFKAERNTTFRLELPFGIGGETVILKAGETRVFEKSM